MRMNKILYVSDAKSIHTRRWAEYYRDQGVQVHIASFRAEAIPGVTLHILPTYGLGRVGYLFALPALRRLCKQIAPDVVHAQYVTSYGFVSALAGIHPLVLTAWGTDVLISPNQSKFMRLLASYAVRHADAVTTVAQHMNSAVSSLGIAAEDVFAIPFGVDTEKFVPPEKPRSEDQPLQLICTRNFSPIYSIHTLLAALETVAARGIRLKVDLVGDGPLKNELLSHVEKAGMSSWVTFHGHVNHTLLAQLLAKAHIFVTPAISDGNNVSLNEAMACACFPIATDIPANAQWITDNVNGLLYAPGDAGQLARCILQAVENTELRSQATRMNRMIVEERADWRVCVGRMNDVYAKVMNDAGKC